MDAAVGMGWVGDSSAASGTGYLGHGGPDLWLGSELPFLLLFPCLLPQCFKVIFILAIPMLQCQGGHSCSSFMFLVTALSGIIFTIPRREEYSPCIVDLIDVVIDFVCILLLTFRG